METFQEYEYSLLKSAGVNCNLHVYN